MKRVVWFLYALGKAGLPEVVQCVAGELKLDKTVKHDFYAATGFYLDAAGERYVIKINRRVSVLGLRLVGRFLATREVRAYQKLSDLEGIPAFVDWCTDTGFIHQYIDGHPLEKGRAVPDGFFDQLLELVDQLNRRGIAYVDTNKPQNIIQGIDGRPYLIDFQIHFDSSRWWPGVLGRRLLRIFHRADVYHVLKNKRRFRPDELTDAQRQIVEKRGLAVRFHRTLTKPYFWVRRPVMRWLRSTGRVMPEQSK